MFKFQENKAYLLSILISFIIMFSYFIISLIIIFSLLSRKIENIKNLLAQKILSDKKEILLLTQEKLALEAKLSKLKQYLFRNI